MTKLTMEEKQQLIRMALAAREKAYAPYSDFMVGAALRAADGRIFTGCNVENAAFTPTSCAERTALFKAVAEGVTAFTDIAVVGSRRGEVNRQITSPCGVCRLAMTGKRMAEKMRQYGNALEAMSNEAASFVSVAFF